MNTNIVTQSRRALLALVPACVGAFFLATGGSAAQDGVLAQPVEPTVVFLVRHAEKGDDDARDPGLSDAGGRRALELARVFGGAGITHLFASEYQRTQRTLAALSEHIGVEVTVVTARDPRQQLAALVDLPPGSVALVCGHSNTVPDLAARLGGTRGEGDGPAPLLGEEEYDRIFQVVLPPRGATEGPVRLAPKVIELRYGANE